MMSCEWLALPDGGIRRVVTVGDELLDPAEVSRRLPKVLCCVCGRVAPYGRTCGDGSCIESLWGGWRRR
jgi:hypothetical protein